MKTSITVTSLLAGLTQVDASFLERFDSVGIELY
jgi:hypothetical protein